ncbi:30S ribosomal protein S18 [Candidatus Karelsulcia muelleri]
MNKKAALKYLTPLNLETKPKKKKCYFQNQQIHFIDYKNFYLLKKFLNERGEILPRRITGITAKNQRRLKIAIKRCRHIGLLPFTTDNFKEINI